MKTKLLFVMFIMASFCCNMTFGQIDEVKRLLTRAQTAYSMGEYDDALNEYLKIQQMAPRFPDIYKALGDVYEKLGKVDDLQNAIKSYNEYLRLLPNAEDAEKIKTKIYALEYLFEKQEKQAAILDDLSGTWLAVDNLAITRDKKTGITNYYYDFVFNISEIQKTGTYRVSIVREGCRYYRETIIEKTVNSRSLKYI